MAERDKEREVEKLKLTKVQNDLEQENQRRLQAKMQIMKEHSDTIRQAIRIKEVYQKTKKQLEKENKLKEREEFVKDCYMNSSKQINSEKQF